MNLLVYVVRNPGANPGVRVIALVPVADASPSRNARDRSIRTTKDYLVSAIKKVF
jgi:hypothetical protein